MGRQKEEKTLYETWQGCRNDRKFREAFAAVMDIRGEFTESASIYTPEILYLFAGQQKLVTIANRAAATASSMYLIHRMKYARASRRPSHYICILTKESAMLIPTDRLKNYYLISRTREYDWDLEPSKPDPQMVRDLENLAAVVQAPVYRWQDESEEQAFLERLRHCQAPEQIDLFSYMERFADGSEEETEATRIEETQGKGGKEEDAKDEDSKSGNALKETTRCERDIYLARIQGRDIDEENLQLTGDFYTPLPFAEKAMVYLGRVIGPQWWTTGKYRLWDMAAGTGNLEYVLPPGAQRYCYISTISEEETEYCRRMFPGACVFQYDYLNDDVDFMQYNGLEAMGIGRKMPPALIEDLADPDIRWIILLNPPYSGDDAGEGNGTVSGEETRGRMVFSRMPRQNKGESYLPIPEGKKTWATTTKVQQMMMGEGMGLASRDLPSQFFYRIHQEFAGKTAYLGLLSRMSYLTSEHTKKIRDTLFRYQYEKGFMFSSMNFKGCKHKFPYGFFVWNLKYSLPLTEQEILADVYNRDVEKTDTVKVEPGRRVEVEL